MHVIEERVVDQSLIISSTCLIHELSKVLQDNVVQAN